MFWLNFASKRTIFTRRLTAIHLKFPRFEQVRHFLGMNVSLKELVSYSSTKSKYFKARAQWHQAKAHQNDKLFGEMISRLRVAEGITKDLSKVLTKQNDKLSYTSSCLLVEHQFVITLLELIV